MDLNCGGNCFGGEIQEWLVQTHGTLSPCFMVIAEWGGSLSGVVVYRTVWTCTDSWIGGRGSRRLQQLQRSVCLGREWRNDVDFSVTVGLLLSQWDAPRFQGISSQTFRCHIVAVVVGGCGLSVVGCGWGVVDEAFIHVVDDAIVHNYIFVFIVDEALELDHLLVLL
ncbi:expressed unknown protein [Seminavis robusta]|uniref:Uncharacterized protein n=1 Tax=Seminavis robusta TaxID=568900 RepID=A0A9N8DTB1_9STRA|nr:expressed unknown protein [Seminavis robusta]|eukprot:Sro336_g120251.1  (167) ;mRNA; r:10028-10528